MSSADQLVSLSTSILNSIKLLLYGKGLGSSPSSCDCLNPNAGDHDVSSVTEYDGANIPEITHGVVF